MKQFNTVEGVYDNIDSVSGKKLKEKLENSREDAFMSKDLATINKNSPIEVTLQDTVLKIKMIIKIKLNYSKVRIQTIIIWYR